MPKIYKVTRNKTGFQLQSLPVPGSTCPHHLALCSLSWPTREPPMLASHSPLPKHIYWGQPGSPTLLLQDSMALPFCITGKKKEEWVFIFKTNISHPPAVPTFPSHADGNELETQFPETTSCTFSPYKPVISTFSQSEIKYLLAFSSATSLKKACTVVQFLSLARPGVAKQLMEVQMREMKMSRLSCCSKGAERARRGGCQVAPWQLTGIFRVGLSALIDCNLCNKRVSVGISSCASIYC